MTSLLERPAGARSVDDLLAEARSRITRVTPAEAIARIRAATKTPILGGLPFGHVTTKVTMPVGARVQLLVDGRNAFIGW